VQTMLLQPGDVVERAGDWGTKHRGIFAGYDAWGRGIVIHNAKGDYVRQVLFEVFAQKLPVVVASRIASDIWQQQLIVARAQSQLGRRYDLLKFNCDHLVTYAQTGVANSPQLQALAGLTGLAVVALGIFHASRNA
jgi:hypothetical protein